MSIFKSPKTQLVELLIGRNGTLPGPNGSTYFDPQPQLQSYNNNRTVYIKAVETFSDQALIASPFTAGFPTANDVNIVNATLTLVVRGTEEFQKIPLACMNRIWAADATFVPFTWQPFIFRNVFEVDWAKSYVTTINTPAEPFAYLFQFHYSYYPDADDTFFYDYEGFEFPKPR